MDNLVGGRHATAAANLRRHFVYILLSLGKAAMVNKWLVLSLDKAAYAHDKTLKSYGLLQAPTKAIVDYLERHNQAIVIKGKKYNNNPARSRRTCCSMKVKTVGARRLHICQRAIPTKLI